MDMDMEMEMEVGWIQDAGFGMGDLAQLCQHQLHYKPRDGGQCDAFV